MQAMESVEARMIPRSTGEKAEAPILPVDLRLTFIPWWVRNVRRSLVMKA